MNYEDFSKGNLLIMDNEGFPINLSVNLMYEDDEIRFELIRGFNFVVNQRCKLQLRNMDPKRLFFQTILLDGEIQRTQNKDQYIFKIKYEIQEVIDCQNNLISQLVSTLPEGKQPVKEFNKKLLHEILTKQNQCLLIINIASNIHIHRITTIPNSGSLQFEIESGNKLISIFEYVTKGTLVFDQKEKSLREISISGDIKFVEQSQNTEIYNFAPRSMIYGDQSNMETLQINNETTFSMGSITRNVRVKTKYWFNLLRIPLILFSLIPLMIGSMLADPQSGSLNINLLILEIVTLIFFQIAANLLNDYFDHKSDSDDYAIIYSKLNAGSRFLQLGLISEDQIKKYSIFSLLFGIMLGVYINYLVGGIDILVIGTIGAVVIVFYSLPPLKLSYRWYGDILFAFTIFPLILIGSSFVQTNRYNNLFEIVLIGLSMASFVIVILFVGNIMSYDAEKAAQKTTFTVKFGKQKTITTMILLLTLHYLVEIILFTSEGEFLQLIPIIGSIGFSFYSLHILKNKIDNIVIQEKSFRLLVYAFLTNYIPIVIILSNY